MRMIGLTEGSPSALSAFAPGGIHLVSSPKPPLPCGSSIFTAAFIPRITGNLVDKVACCVLVALILPKLPARIHAMSGNPFFRGKGE